MKTLKKMMALAIAMVMMLSMSISVFATSGDPTTTDPAPAATNNKTITVADGDTHVYEAYQIFTADEADGVLSNVHWGANGTGTVGELVPKATLDAIAAITGTDTEKAAALSAYATLSNPFVAEIKAGSPATVAPGYYLIKDKTGVTLEDGDEYSLYIVEVAQNVTITRKASNTEAHKTVDDVNDSDTTATADNGQKQTSSDYDIGDEVPYHLTATLSEKVEQYKKYHITFVDTLEAGKFDAISALDIKMDGAAIAATDDYTVEITGDDAATEAGFTVTIEWTPKDGKTLASLNGAEVTIDFTATLGEGAAIGEEGNKNTFQLKYSNNPNDTDGSDEGETPEEEVITFTYKVVVDKFDDKNQPLENAGFTLYKVSKADAEAGVTGADAKAKNEAWAAKQIKTWTTTAEAGATAGKNNRFSFEGIDDGYYVLCETTTPAGYNTLDPQVFKVTATHGGTDNKGITLDTLSGDKVSGDITFTATKADGALSTNVTNNKGGTLPETGGIGTTIFYILGAILVLGAGIVLVTRRRMSAN